ncbi:MAG TPA: hypothetical protein VGK67_28650 [Myxococcales bacterium]|jgi:hypothetical protein
MTTILVFGFGFLAAGGLFAALAFHFLRTPTGLVLARKARLGFQDTYVDVRGWGAVDYLKNPGLAAILAKRGVASALGVPQTPTEKGKKALDEGLEKIQQKLR